jgi:1-aminocyclopropane-1-carboxylate deaminase
MTRWATSSSAGWPAQTRDQIARIARQTAKLIGVGRELTDDDILLDERYHAGTYGIPDDATVLYAHFGGQPALNAYSALFS